ncbi:interferon-induced very large GTPase 1-like [Sardina pilchardus]|uniref:interferon-induced very large GTPase 1-like n=1 Tax=Sardina pilchardus TaxID=27697 RepID=UPI002E0E0A25
MSSSGANQRTPERPVSPMSSERSEEGNRPDFTMEGTSVHRAGTDRPPSPVASVISMKSDRSRDKSLDFKEEDKGTDVSSRGEQCDVCPLPAVKTCLTCNDSYCMTCVRPHYTDPDLEGHQLQDLQHQDLQHQDLQHQDLQLQDLQVHQGRCEQHQKKLKFYCRTDQSAVCSRCLVHSHKGHDVIEQDTERWAQDCTVTKIKDVPPPGPIQFPSVLSNAVTLRWSPLEGAAGPYRYRVTWRRGHETRRIEVDGSEVEVERLLPGEKYHFSVATLTEDGRQSTCVERSVLTEVPVPKNLTVAPGSTCVFVDWGKPDGLEDKVSFLFQLFKGKELVKSKFTDSLQFFTSGLQHNNDYTIQVSTALENNCQSKPTSEHFRTEIPAPEHLTVRSISASSAGLRWLVSLVMEQTPHSFLVSYQSEGTELKSFSTESCSTDITGLEPGTEYTVEVYTQLQHGGQSQPASVHMKTEIPAPEHLTVRSISASSAGLRWLVSPVMQQTPHSFLVSYQSEGTELKSFSTESCSTDITGLEPGTEYAVEVYTQLQHGGESQPASVHMKTGFSLSDLLEALNLKNEEKITFSSVLEISSDMVCDKPAQSLKELPSTFLRKLMMCNLNARNTKCTQKETATHTDLSCIDDPYESGCINPLDLITALFHCSDPFLQQEMVSKMAMCQFAVPLLLPNCDTQQSTLMLWAMRDIVKIYRPPSLARDRECIEGRIVEMDIPMVSFVRLGGGCLPKSQILNKLISNPHQHNDTFVHHHMECGDVPRRISDGLVEVSWYLPSGNPNVDKFTKPVTIANLRGDGRLFQTQMSFLCQTSAAVFIFSDDLDGDLSSLTNSENKAELFLVTSSETENFNMKTLKDTYRKHNFTNMIVGEMQCKAFMKRLSTCLSDIVEKTTLTTKVEAMADIADNVGCLTDERCADCVRARNNALKITGKLTDIEKFKKKNLPLHGQLWKDISRLEKEICRMREANKDIERYRSSLSDREKELRNEQHEKIISPTILNFLAGISPPAPERLYFLKWLKIQLDTLSRRHLSELREQYNKIRNEQGNMNEMAKLNEQISRSSLGPEHFFRELGQLYECACSLSEDDPTSKTVHYLPALCAQMLLDGFPVELVDGDASNIPMKWISAVLTQLHKKVHSKSRILVMTVLGVQGTGKSTLLNTMFGVQFAVSSGRCTRGAFMLMIKVSEEFRSKLDCDFLMVIDTEGLKSPELAGLKTSYEHDNELATLVVGLSDVTIINIAMESNQEMKDILQIAVHAFLRMKEVGKKPRCVFVHQNVSDLSAHVNNMRDRNKLVEQLNEMTRAAAKMEKKEANTKFTDVMEYDPDRDSYYIPGLWHGTPPMASVSTGYSEAAYELKKSLIDLLQIGMTERHNATEFLWWTQSLWNAVKFENFIFNFRNSLVAEAYTQVCSEYNKWEWSFQKEANSWLLEKETYISNFGFADGKNAHTNSLRAELDKMISDASVTLDRVEVKLVSHLEEYFSKKYNVILVEKYKEEFKNSARCLRRETENCIKNSLHQAVEIREGMEKVNEIKNAQAETIEKGVLELLQTCQKSNVDFTDECLDQEFEKMWKGINAKLSFNRLEAKNLHNEVYDLLKSNFETKAGHSRKKLNECVLNKCGMEEFTVKLAWFKSIIWSRNEKEMQEICNNIILDSDNFVSEKVQSKSDFHNTYIKEILRGIDEKAKDCEMDEECEVALKLHVCGRALREFQKMHDRFIEINNPQRQLELSKSKFKEEFKDLFLKRDQCQKKAKEFTEECLRPSIQDYVSKKLGPDIADEMMKGDNGVDYSTSTHLQYSLLKQMLHEDKYELFKAYICSYESFVKHCILMETDQMAKDGKIAILQKRRLSEIVKKITDAVTILTEQADSNTDIKTFIQNICTHLNDQLIFSKEYVNSFLILNTAKIEQFSRNLKEFVKQMEKSLAQSYDNPKELPFKPHGTFFNRLIGCRKQCPFCGTPCEAGGKEHSEHFSSMHRPQGLGCFKWIKDKKLVTDICSSVVISGSKFQCDKTNGKLVPYKEYRTVYPDWKITGDAKVQATDYWKYVLMKFNTEFARHYNSEPADIPSNWTELTLDNAIESLKKSFNITAPLQTPLNLPSGFFSCSSV